MFKIIINILHVIKAILYGIIRFIQKLVYGTHNLCKLIWEELKKIDKEDRLYIANRKRILKHNAAIAAAIEAARPPISPFLEVYKLQIGSACSIYGRISGVLLIIYLIVKAGILMHPGFSLFLVSSIPFCWVPTFFYLTLDVYMLHTMVYHILFAIRYAYWDFTDGQGKHLPINIDYYHKSFYYLFGLSFIITAILSHTFL
jgi:succinate dehydrogenase/fumarate reductase cytochrome b subunit